MTWKTDIGIEVHAQLTTQTKLFSGAITSYGAKANEHANIIDCGLPGVLPVLNKAVIAKAIRLGIAINASIDPLPRFARKNYFYPDLPKGYQISQSDNPILAGGFLESELNDGTMHRVNITRAHLEEDAGKLLHDFSDGKTGVDLNRAGSPLLEIVSEPDIHSAEQASAYLKNLHQLLMYLDVCDGNLQEGSFRADINISIRPHDSQELGTRCEIKNLNSFRFVEKAIHYEVSRQKDILTSGNKVIQQTRLYNPDKDCTYAMRNKENADDYRYFPDPDLLPIHIDANLIESVKKNMPELPQHKQQRFMDQYNLPKSTARQLTERQDDADFFEACVANASHEEAQISAKLICGDITAQLRKSNLKRTQSELTSDHVKTLTTLIAQQEISMASCKKILTAFFDKPQPIKQIVDSCGLRQSNDSDQLAAWIDEIITSNPNQVQEYRAGKEKLMSFFVGQVMKMSKGQANPGATSKLLKDKLQQKPHT